MDVYVVLEGHSVLGAAVSQKGAESIADRGSPGEWSDWRDGPTHVDRRRERGDLRITQRIVRTPLSVPVPDPALWSGVSDPIGDLRAIKGESLAAIGFDRSTNMPDTMITEMRRAFDRAVLSSLEPREIRVGAGAARRWIEGQAEKIRSVQPDDTRAQFAGIAIIIDPDLPHNVIKIGDATYVLGTAGGLIRVGEAVVYSEDSLRDTLFQAYRSTTQPD